MNKYIARAVIIILAIVCVGAFMTGSKEKVSNDVVICDDIIEATEATETPIPLSDDPVIFPEVDYEETYTYWDAVALQDAITYYIDSITHARDSGEYTHEACDTMTKEISRLHECSDLVQNDIDRFEKWEEEHFYAAKVWQYYRVRGISEHVVAGILGNMMVETSGGTLNLKPTIYSPGGSFYGLCQWSLYYRPSAADMTFEEQLEYLYLDMPGEFDTFGFCYRNGFTYEDFLGTDDFREAAIAFAKVYERCDSASYGARQRAAEVAYSYFTGEM